MPVVGPAGRGHCWLAAPLQSQIWSWVPLLVLLAGSSRQRPDGGLTRAPLDCNRQTWAPVPLQSHSWIGVPLAVLAARTSPHLPPIPVIGPVGPDDGGGGEPPWVYAAT